MTTTCDARAQVLKHLAFIVGTHADDPAAGGLHVVRTMQASGLHWPELLPPVAYGYKIYDRPMLHIIGVAMGYARHFTPFELATLAVIAAKPASIECKGYLMTCVPEHGQEDRKLVMEMIEKASLLDRDDRWQNYLFPVT